MPTLLERLKAHPKVDLIYKDQDGWWIELKKGWAFDPAEPPYGGAHTLSEDSLTKLREHLTLVQKCECVDCIEGQDHHETRGPA